MVSAVSVSAPNVGIGSSIGIDLKCGIGTSLFVMQDAKSCFSTQAIAISS